MAYVDTETFNITATSAALVDILAAMITHFTSAPGRWGLNAVTPVAGAALAIKRVTGGVNEIGIRRNGTTALVTAVDPGAAITAVGTTSTSATGSASMSPDSYSGTAWPTVSADFDIVEHDQGVSFVFYDTGKSYTPVVVHAGQLIEPLRSSDAADGLDGHINLTGTPSSTGLTSLNAWFPTSTQTNGSRIRVFDSGGAAVWKQSSTPVNPENGSASRASTNGDGTIKSVRPILMSALDVNSSNDLDCGVSDYIGSAPIGTSPAFANQVPRLRLESPLADDEAWLYIRKIASACGLVLNWQRTINPA